ncbi:MAG: methyl-accepting chemotaxis protein, partial [Planctomycetota bacterium]
MKFRDISVGVQLRIAFGAILVLVAGLGVMAYSYAEIIWEETRGLYEHPLQVRRALGEMKADILAMQSEMKDAVVVESQIDRGRAIQGIDVLEADVYKQIDVVYGTYLGPRKDVDDVHSSFVRWKAIREEVFGLLREGKAPEARQRVGHNGAGEAHVIQLLHELGDVSDFAIARGDKFYQDAREHKDAVLVRLGVAMAMILALALGIGLALFRSIRGPLTEMTRAADEYRQGRFEVRSRFASANEFGTLSAAFNGLAQAVQTMVQARDAAAGISGVMLRHDDLGPFCRELLAALMEPTGSQVGAVYLLDDTGTRFDHFESIGLEEPGRTAFAASVRE